MGLRSWIVNREVRSWLKGRYKTMSNDKKTTVLGVILAALIAANIDYGSALLGNLVEISKAAGVVLVAVGGFLVNRPDRKEY